jgi:hypothetical protein
MISVPSALSGGPCDALLFPGVALPGGVDHLRVLVNSPVRTHSQRFYVFLDVVDDVSHCVEPVRPLE